MQELEEQIVRIAESVWNTLLNRQLQSPPAQAAPAGEDWLSVRVAVHGAWTGSVVLRCPYELACHAASSMFTIPPEQLERADVSDAFGEIGNIVAGNLKALLPGPSDLAVPLVEAGAIASVGADDGSQARVSLGCDGQLLWIQIDHEENLVENNP